MSRKRKEREIAPVIFVKAKEKDDYYLGKSKEPKVKRQLENVTLSGKSVKSFYEELVGAMPSGTCPTEYNQKPTHKHGESSTSRAEHCKDKTKQYGKTKVGHSSEWTDDDSFEYNDRKRTKGKKRRSNDRVNSENSAQVLTKHSKSEKRRSNESVNSDKSADILTKQSKSKRGRGSSQDKSATFNDRDQQNFLRLAQEGDVKALSVYIKEGMDVNVTDQYGWSALMCAACSGRVDVLELLLDKGADMTLVNRRGQTAKDIAVVAKMHKVVELLSGNKSKHKLQKVNLKSSDSDSSFYCDVCKSNITDCDEKAHSTSTIHLFNLKLPARGTSYFLQENNKGFQIMLQRGWDKETGLGTEGQGQKFPVKTVLKRDRLGLGNKVKDKPKVTHFGAKDDEAVKNPKSILRQMRKTTLSKRHRSKQEKKERKKEVAFRREFYMD